MAYLTTSMTNEERTAQARLRREALAALIEGTLCPMCKRPMYLRQKLELDHIIPRSKGGKTTKQNTRLTHKSCNQHAGRVLGNRSPKRRGIPNPHSRPPRRKLPEW
jgi:5-methylcytosine-specific restriction endonuclease McrA